jgi:signal transduction histidine kinase
VYQLIYTLLLWIGEQIFGFGWLLKPFLEFSLQLCYITTLFTYLVSKRKMKTKKIEQFFKEYFYFSQTERSGIIGLVVIIVFILAARNIIQALSKQDCFRLIPILQPGMNWKLWVFPTKTLKQ